MIGKALSLELRNHGHEVTILTRRETFRTNSSETMQSWDGADAGKLAQLLGSQQAVVNLAGESIGTGRWSQQRKALILSSRLVPGKALAEALTTMQEAPQIVLQASAVGYYGTGDETFDEKSPTGADWLAGVCDQWESSLTGVANKTRLVFLRSGVVLSRQGGVLAQLTLPMRLFVGGPLGNGRQWLSWIHLQDEVSAMRFLIERADSRGVYNLTAPDPATNRIIEKTLARLMHRPYWLPVPAFALKLVLGEMSTLVLDGQKVLPVRLLQAGFKFDFPGLEPALHDLLN
jgi:uncharacterized protein (TIGR01777 family)